MSTYAKFSGASSGGGGGGGGSGITQLTGPVTAGPGSGSQATTITDPLVISEVAGGNAASDNLTLDSTTNSTKGYVGVVDASALIVGPYAPTSYAFFSGEGATPIAQLYVSNSGTDPVVVNFAQVLFDTWGGGNNDNPNLTFGNTGGTAASPDYLPSGAAVGEILFSEYQGSSTLDIYTGHIIVSATEQHSVSAFGTEMRFQTVPNTTASRVNSLNLQGNLATFSGQVASGSAATGGFAVYLPSPSLNVGLHLNNVGGGFGAHLNACQSTPNSVATNTGSGTGATASALTNSGDTSGQITLTTGSSVWASGAQVTVSFFNTYNSAPMVVFSPANATAALRAGVVGVYATSTSSSFTFNFADADTAANTYVWNYFITEIFYP